MRHLLTEHPIRTEDEEKEEEEKKGKDRERTRLKYSASGAAGDLRIDRDCL